MKKTFTLLFLGILSVFALASPKSVSGTWQVVANGKSNPNMKLVLTSKGGFKFIGSNYSSSGTYKVEGDAIQLNWTLVDGQPVKPGTMKKTLVLTPENTFTIDRFTYARRG
jgi:hypothetical protein